jgi:putative endonuclease
MGFISDIMRRTGISKGEPLSEGASRNILLGKDGEARARKYLKKKKYKILEQNYRSRLGEIDIIATCKDVLIFIEVKTRSSDAFGSAIEAVDKKKQRHIIKVAEGFLQERSLGDDINIRFDVVGVEFRDNGIRIEHIEDAFNIDDI